MPGETYCSNTARHAASKHHIPTNTECRSRHQGYPHYFAYRGDTCRVVKNFSNIPIISHVDVREQHNRMCPHHIHIPQGGPGNVETREEWKIRQAGMHPIDSTDNIWTSLPLSLICPGCFREITSYGIYPRIEEYSSCIIHFIYTNRCTCTPDNPGDLPVCKEIPGASRTDTKIPHLNPGMYECKQVSVETRGVFHLQNNRTCE